MTNSSYIVRTSLIALTSLFLVACSAGGQDSYDLVILNGRIMDPETEFDAVRNVGIKDVVGVTINFSF